MLHVGNHWFTQKVTEHTVVNTELNAIILSVFKKEIPKLLLARIPKQRHAYMWEVFKSMHIFKSVYTASIVSYN